MKTVKYVSANIESIPLKLARNLEDEINKYMAVMNKKGKIINKIAISTKDYKKLKSKASQVLNKNAKSNHEYIVDNLNFNKFMIYPVDN